MMGWHSRTGGLLCALSVAVMTLFLSLAARAADFPAVPEKPQKTVEDEPCRLTPLEKHWMRNPESQWPPSRRERVKRCDAGSAGPAPGIKTRLEKGNRTD